MNVVLKYKNLEMTVTGTTELELVENLARVQDVFCNDECGLCGSNNIVWQVRNVEDNKYYELICRECWAKLPFGVHRDGKTLFPKRSMSEEEAGKHEVGKRGWRKWLKNGEGGKPAKKAEGNSSKRSPKTSARKPLPDLDTNVGDDEIEF